ncbi:hypothetical protein F4813DRAFT_160421 [Daldinia decipiens]|uniref:uncharacterized protein n=1 Tax=Daldinia decipiens TaxID=326647 RepID=UPI0020C227E5|nr:uncharacterized protein F4813DRAFT_160421 [Daldinia decipiens]KAI1655474.1 hypothetical protein F4813DRAFT_160421 [Daldinia decipiens]
MKPPRGPHRRNYMEDDIDVNIAIVNESPVPKNVDECTKREYRRQLQNWDDYNKKWGPKSVDNLADLKEFVLRMGKAIRKHKDLSPEDTLPYSGLKSYWKQFTAGYRIYRGPIRDEFVTSIKRFIEPRGELGKLLNLVPDSGPRRHATEVTFAWEGCFLWSLDWKTFSRPRFRVDLWAAVSAGAYTSGRISDYLESGSRFGTGIGLHYKDTEFIVFRNEHGLEEFSLQLTKFLKGKHPKSSKLPQPDIHEGGFGAPQPLYMNPLLFFLVIFCVNGALRDYRGEQGLFKLLDLKLCEDTPMMRIHWHRSVLNQPLFTGMSGKILRAREVSEGLRALGIRSGFPKPPTFHDFRAEGLTNIDLKPFYSDTQRNRIAGHENNQMHQQHYAARNGGIDSQAVYQDKEARSINLGRLFRLVEVEWQPSLWQSLPLMKRRELMQTEEYKAKELPLLEKGKLETASLTVKEGSESSEECKNLLHPNRKPRRDIKRLEQMKLQEYWEETSTGNIVGSEVYACRGVNRPFSRLRPILPNRRRLADLLPMSSRLRSEKGREALRELIALYQSKSEVYRPGLDKCPCECNPKTQLHVYRCTKKSRRFAEFCFFCNEWLYDFDAWEQHCHSHLSLDHLPVEVAYERVESTFLPGYCPYCLWDTSLSAASRLRQFCTKSQWEAEVRDHGLRWQRQHCPDERCAEEFKNGDSFVCHMHDLHRVPEELLIATARGLKRKADMVEDIRQPKIKIRNAWDDATSVFDTWSFEEAT